MGTMSFRLVAKRLESRRHHLKLGRADVRAVGEAEEDQHVAAAEVPVGDRLSGLVDEGEGAADQRLARSSATGGAGAAAW